MLCFVGESEGGDREVWEGGEVGGFEAYLLADDEGDKEPAEVYKAVSRGGCTLAFCRTAELAARPAHDSLWVRGCRHCLSLVPLPATV